MKRILFFALAILLVCGVAFSDTIPAVTKAYDIPVVWTASVYNGSGAAIATGRVVSWDFDTSNVTGTSYDDMCNWVKASVAAQDPWTAGVTPIDGGIANGDVGIIIIKGPAVVYDGTGSSVGTAGDLVGSSTTSGALQDISAVGSDEAFLGVCIKARATHQGYTNDALIYVNPTLSFDD